MYNPAIFLQSESGTGPFSWLPDKFLSKVEYNLLYIKQYMHGLKYLEGRAATCKTNC